MDLFNWLGNKKATAKGFQPRQTSGQKKRKAIPQQQTFILEPILTPSGLVDGVDDTPDPVVLDLNVEHVDHNIDVDLNADSSIDVGTLDADIDNTSGVEVNLETTDSIDTDPLEFIERNSTVEPSETTAELAVDNLTHSDSVESQNPATELITDSNNSADLVDSDIEVTESLTVTKTDSTEVGVTSVDVNSSHEIKIEHGNNEPVEELASDDLDTQTTKSPSEITAQDVSSGVINNSETIDQASFANPSNEVSLNQTDNPEITQNLGQVNEIASSNDGEIDYTLPIPKYEFISGEFTVDVTGKVSVDFLFDGGGYQGELAIFNLEGMEQFAPGSEAFIKEAARRALSHSELGYVAISDRTEGAAFSGNLGEPNQNQGEYLGVKTFSMRPGDKFAIMLVPDGTVQQVFDNPNIGGSQQPLFSLGTANPNDTFHVGQIADVTGHGSTFVIEDWRVDTGSDRDYNDVIFQVKGATGSADKLDELINPNKDWRKEELGKALLTYVNTPPTDLDLVTPDDVVSLVEAQPAVEKSIVSDVVATSANLSTVIDTPVVDELAQSQITSNTTVEQQVTDKVTQPNINSNISTNTPVVDEAAQPQTTSNTTIEQQVTDKVTQPNINSNIPTNTPVVDEAAQPQTTSNTTIEQPVPDGLTQPQIGSNTTNYTPVVDEVIQESTNYNTAINTSLVNELTPLKAEPVANEVIQPQSDSNAIINTSLSDEVTELKTDSNIVIEPPIADAIAQPTANLNVAIDTLKTSETVNILDTINQKLVQELDNNLTQLQTAIAKHSDALVGGGSHPDVELAIANIKTTLEKDLQLAQLIQEKPELLSQLGISNANVTAAQQWIQNSDVAQELGKPVVDLTPNINEPAADFILTKEQPTQSVNLAEIIKVGDADASMKYELIQGNSNSLTVKLEGNELQLKASPQVGTSDVLIKVTDEAGNSFVKNLLVTTTNVNAQTIQDLDRAIAQWRTAIDANSDGTDAAANIGAIVEQKPELIELIVKSKSLSQLGLSDTSISTIQQVLNNPEFAQKLGLSIPIEEILKNPTTALDRYLINGDTAHALLPEDASQPLVGFIDFTKGGHAERVTSAFAAVNPSADYKVLPVYHGEWHSQLVKFVNQVKAAGENHAVVNLSFDLSQVDAIGYTTRYELTPEEHQAIAYAQQNNVLLVVAAGNTGGEMSALGAASTQFDNIITVGAVDKSEQRADYSGYGDGLSLMAPGGEWQNNPNAFVGTSKATAYVTAAASLVWAANPELNYRQVKELLKATASDLETSGWDPSTGSGMVDAQAAVRLAVQTRFMPLESLFSSPNPQTAPPKSFSGEGRVLTLARPSSENTEEAIASLTNQQQQLIDQWQILALVGNPSLTQEELKAEVERQFANTLEAYKQVNTEAAITTAQAEQWGEELALATNHYQIELGRSQALTGREQELIQLLADLAKEKVAKEAEQKQHLEIIVEAIKAAQKDVNAAQGKRNFELIEPEVRLFVPSAIRDAANQHRQLAAAFRQQALAQAALKQSHLGQKIWQIVGYEKRGKKRTPIWGYVPSPQHQWQAGIAEQNRQRLEQLAQIAEQQAIALEQNAQFLDKQKNLALPLSPTNLNDAVKVLQFLQQQLAQQKQITQKYRQEFQIAEARRQQNQEIADWHTANLRSKRIEKGRSGKTKEVWDYHPERIPPRNQAQRNAMLAAEDRQGLERLYWQSRQQEDVIQQQIESLQSWIGNWAELNQVTQQAIEYEIASHENRLQAEQDLQALFTPVYRQELETIDFKIGQANAELEQLKAQQEAQDIATAAVEAKLNEIQAQVEAIQKARKEAQENLQNFLSTTGNLLPQRERLSAVEKQIQALNEQINRVEEMMQLGQFLTNPSESLRTQLQMAANYLSSLKEELEWALLQQDFLNMAIPDSSQRLAIADLIAQLEKRLQDRVATNTLPLQRWIDFLRQIEASGANFLEGFNNLTARLAKVNAEKAHAEQTLTRVKQEYQTLNVVRGNLEKNIANTAQEIEDKDLEITAYKEKIARISAEQVTLPIQLEAAQRSLAEKQAELKAKNQEIPTIQQELRQVRAQLAPINAQISQQEALLQSYESQIQRVGEAAKRPYLQQAANLERQYQQHQANINQLTAQIAQEPALFAQRMATRQAQREQQLQSLMQAHNQQMSQLQSRREAGETASRNAANQQENVHQKAEQKEASRKSYQQEAERLNSDYQQYLAEGNTFAANTAAQMRDEVLKMVAQEEAAKQSFLQQANTYRLESEQYLAQSENWAEQMVNLELQFAPRMIAWQEEEQQQQQALKTDHDNKMAQLQANLNAESANARLVTEQRNRVVEIAVQKEAEAKQEATTQLQPKIDLAQQQITELKNQRQPWVLREEALLERLNQVEELKKEIGNIAQEIRAIQTQIQQQPAQLALLENQAIQQQEQREQLGITLAKLEQQKRDKEQLMADKYREVELATSYLKQTQDEAERLKKRIDYLKEIDLPEQKYRENNTEWQKVLDNQMSATEALLSTRKTAEEDRLKLVPLQSRLSEVNAQLKQVEAERSQLAQVQEKAKQSLQIKEWQEQAQELQLQAWKKQYEDLAIVESDAYYQARDRQRNSWYWTGREYVYNPQEAAAYRLKLQETSFIADQRNKLWQQQQLGQQTLTQLEKSIAEQKQQIEQRQPQLDTLEQKIADLTSQAKNLQAEIQPIAKQLAPVLQKEQTQTQKFRDTMTQGQALASDLAGNTLATATSLKNLITFGLQASESDVDYFALEVDPKVREFIEQLRQRQPAFTVQIDDLTELIANWEKELSLTTEPTAKENLTNLISQAKAQLNSLQTWQGENTAALAELEELLNQALAAITPLRQKQELEIRQKLDSNETRIQELESQLGAEKAAKTAIEKDTVLAHAELTDTVRQDLRDRVTHWTQQLQDSNQMTRELGKTQQELSQNVDNLLDYLQKEFADPHGRYYLSEGALRDAIAFLGVLAPKSDEAQRIVLETEQNIDNLNHKITQDKELWPQIESIVNRYDQEAQAIATAEKPYPPIQSANQKLAKSQALQQQIAVITQQIQAGDKAKRDDVDYYNLVQNAAALMQQSEDWQQQAENDLMAAIDALHQLFDLGNPIAHLKAETLANIRQTLDKINPYLPQLETAKNNQAVLAARAAATFALANQFEQKAATTNVGAEDYREYARTLRQIGANYLAQANKWREKREELYSTIASLATTASDPLHKWEFINNNLNNGTAIDLLQKEIQEGYQKYQKLFEQAKANYQEYQAQGAALISTSNAQEQAAADFWVHSRKTGPSWQEWREVWYRSGCKKKFTWELVTHYDYYWQAWETNWNLANHNREQGIDSLAQAEKWRQEMERLEPIAKQWADASSAADLAETPIDEARTLIAQLKAAHVEIPAAEAQMEGLIDLLPTLKQELEQAKLEAKAADEKVWREWGKYDSVSAEFRQAIEQVIKQREELNQKAIATQQQLAKDEQWVERQSVALSTELAQVKALQTQLQTQRQSLENQAPGVQAQITATETEIQAVKAEIQKLVQRGILAEDLTGLNQKLSQSEQKLKQLQQELADLPTKAALLNQSAQMLENKAVVLTAQQTALTQKRTLLTAQNEAILAEQRLLDAYFKDPSGDMEALKEQLKATREALAEAQRLAEQAEASSKALTAPLQTLQADLLLQNDEQIQAAREHQQTLRKLVEATETNANYQLQIANIKQKMNQLESQMIPLLTKIAESGMEEAKSLLKVAVNKDKATAAEIYFRDFHHLANDKNKFCTGGLATPQDRILADAYYQEWQTYLALKQRAQAQADAFGQIKRTAQAQLDVLQEQQNNAATRLAKLNELVAISEEDKQTKERDLAVAQAKLDAITDIRNKTEQIFTNLISLEKLNLAQAELEKQIAQQRQDEIEQAVKQRLERERLEVERQRQEAIAKVEQIRQLLAEDDWRRALNQIRGDLSMSLLAPTEDRVQLQTQLAKLIADLQTLETQQPELSDDVKALLAEVRGDLHLALQGKEAATIQENLLKATAGLIGQIDKYQTEINQINQKVEQDNLLLQKAQANLQDASKQLWEQMQLSGELEQLRKTINPVYLQSLYDVAYAQNWVDISNEMAQQARDVIGDIIKQRKDARKAREKAAINSILSLVTQVISLVSMVLLPFPGTAPIGLALGAVAGGISTVQAAMNGDVLGAIFSAVMTGASFVSGALSQGLKTLQGAAQAVAQKAITTIKTFQSLASGAFNGVRNIISGDSFMGFLQILSGLAGAASSGLQNIMMQSPLGQFGLKVLETLETVPTKVYSGIQAMKNGDWVSGIGSIVSAVVSMGKTFANDFKDETNTLGERFTNILENISSVGIGVSKFITGGLDGLLEGLGDIVVGLQDDMNKFFVKLISTELCNCSEKSPISEDDPELRELARRLHILPENVWRGEDGNIYANIPSYGFVQLHSLDELLAQSDNSNDFPNDEEVTFEYGDQLASRLLLTRQSANNCNIASQNLIIRAFDLEFCRAIIDGIDKNEMYASVKTTEKNLLEEATEKELYFGNGGRYSDMGLLLDDSLIPVTQVLVQDPSLEIFSNVLKEKKWVIVGVDSRFLPERSAQTRNSPWPLGHQVVVAGVNQTKNEVILADTGVGQKGKLITVPWEQFKKAWYHHDQYLMTYTNHSPDEWIQIIRSGRDPREDRPSQWNVLCQSDERPDHPKCHLFR